MKKVACLLIALALKSWTASPLHAQGTEVEGCRVDPEVWGLVPSCAMVQQNGQLFILKELVNSLGEGRWVRVGGRQLAWAATLTEDFVYFDRSGRIVVAHVAVFDNGPSPFHSGLVRVSNAGKWGLANSKGEMVVPLEYDGLLEFDEGRWLACKACKVVREAEHSWFEDGEWFALNRHGHSKRIGTAK